MEKLMKLSMAQELLLLALKDEKGTLAASSTFVKVGLTGAMLLELILDGYLDVVEKKVVVRNPSIHPDPFREDVMLLIRESKKERKLKSWVHRLSDKMPKLVKQMTTSLIAAGIVRHEKGKILWVFPHHKFPTHDPAPEMVIRRRIDDVVLGGSTPDDRTSALIALALACELTGELFDKTERKQAKKRMKEITKANTEGAEVVGQVIQEIQAAVVVVIAAASVASSSS
jgi:golgi phosphoprotein 3